MQWVRTASFIMNVQLSGSLDDGVQSGPSRGAAA
jgi:hypothetical protein